MTWYATTNEFQGVISDEDTGKTIAVSYNPKNAKLLASAPNLLAVLKELISVANGTSSLLMPDWLRRAEEVIQEAENRA